MPVRPGIFAMRANQVTMTTLPKIADRLPVAQVAIRMVGTPTRVVVGEGISTPISPERGGQDLTPTRDVHGRIENGQY